MGRKLSDLVVPEILGFWVGIYNISCVKNEDILKSEETQGK